MPKNKNPKVAKVEVKETPAAMTPKALANELEISPKNLRAYLRREFPRATEDKNTSWRLTDAQIEAARIRFTPTEEEAVEA